MMGRLLTTCLILLVPAMAQAGAWGPSSFENDDALDWVGDCADGRLPHAVEAAFATAMQASYIQASDASAAVAAAEVVATAIGKPPPRPPAELANCVKRQSAQDLRKLVPAARRVLARIRDRKISELSQLWGETKSDDWPEAISDLESRLAK